MDKPKIDQVDRVSQAILKPSGNPQIFTLTLAQFKELYQEIYRQRGNTRLDVVLNGEWALVQFSELCNHRVRILPDNLLRPPLKFLNLHLYLEKDDFEMIFSSATFFGQERYLTLWRFLKEEFQVNGMKALIIFGLSGLFFSLVARSSPNVVASINEVLITISAIFFSIFMLFTISQNLPLMDLSLFKRGLPHRFVQIDKKIANSTIFAVGISALNRALAENPVVVVPSTRFWSQFTVDFTVMLNWSTALAISIIAISLLIVVQYYFKRIQFLYETDLSKKLLDESFSNINKQ